MKNLPNYPKVKFPLTVRIDEPLDLNSHVPFRVAVVSNLLQLNKDPFIRDFSDLEPREYRVLLNIGSYMPIKAADIAYLGRLDTYTVSRAVKSLLKDELIEIELAENNRKIKNLVLTKKGIKVYRELCLIIDKRTQELESVISKEEKAELIRILELLESKSESMIASHAASFQENALQKSNLQKSNHQNKNQQTINKPIPADQKEIIRWHKKSSANYKSNNDEWSYNNQ